MDSTINYLYESLKSLYSIPETHKEETYQAFAIGLDFGISLCQELRMLQREIEE